MQSHLFIAGRCQSKPTLFLAHSFETSMHVWRSAGELRREKMAINNSAGKRCTGDTRHRSSCSLLAAVSSELSGDMSIPSEDCESLECSMRESLSSSAPRSGEVEEEEEFEHSTAGAFGVSATCWCKYRGELLRSALGGGVALKGEGWRNFGVTYHLEAGRQHSGALSWRTVRCRENRAGERGGVPQGVQLQREEVGSRLWSASQQRRSRPRIKSGRSLGLASENGRDR